MCSKIKKNISNSIDEILFEQGIDGDIKIFGNPLEDFDMKELTRSQLKDIRRLLLNKLDTYGLQFIKEK
jgi:hypothetical protein